MNSQNDPDSGKNHSISSYPRGVDLLYVSGKPWLAALISLFLFGFGGIGSLLLGQESKALLLFLCEWILILVGMVTGALPVLLALFHIFTAYDTWVVARRVKAGKTLLKWEWFWNT